MVVTGHFLPGFKAGGALRSVRNLVNCLQDEFEFWILTSDRDLGDVEAYPGIFYGEWRDVGGAKVRYLSPQERSFRGVCQAIRETEHDLLYLNGFFSPWGTIAPLLGRRVGLLPKTPVLLAPRGEFSAGAISLKGGKKRTYVQVAKVAGLASDLYWHASSDCEVADITHVMGRRGKEKFIACDLPDPAPQSVPTGPRGEDGEFHVAFLSRVSPKKNLDYALEVLADVRVPVTFNIYGPAEDQEYWRICEARMSELPPHVSVQYHGPVTPDEVPAVLRANDLFLFPTRGENYGHVIAEALAVGTPVLISDQTPWRGLEARGMGFDLPLSNRGGFVEVIEKNARLDPEERLRQRHKTHAAMLRYREESDDVAANRQMFRQVIEAGKR